MTQLLQAAIEEALKQPPHVQNAIATAIFGQINKTHKQPRPIGLAAGKGKVADDFNDPLPDDELALWTGEAPADPV